MLRSHIAWHNIVFLVAFLSFVTCSILYKLPADLFTILFAMQFVCFLNCLTIEVTIRLPNMHNKPYQEMSTFSKSLTNSASFVKIL